MDRIFYGYLFHHSFTTIASNNDTSTLSIEGDN